MDWDAISAIGEIVGAAAVVISLAYLALQIKNQNAESKAAAMHDISVGFRGSVTMFTDGDIAAIFVKANEDFDSLSKIEIVQFVSSIHALFRVFEEAFNQHRRGRLDEDLWDGMNRQYSSYLSAPAFQHYWNMRRGHYTDKFQRYVDSMERTELGYEFDA